MRTDSVSSAELVRRIATAPTAPDETELCRRFADRIRLYGRRHLRDREACADLVQEVMFSVLDAVRRGVVQDPDRIAGYVLTACRHAVWHMQRNDWRRGDFAEELSIEPRPTLDARRLEHCISALPSRDRDVVYKSFYEEQSAAEIGSEIGVSDTNVRQIRFRALGRLRDCLERGAA